MKKNLGLVSLAVVLIVGIAGIYFGYTFMNQAKAGQAQLATLVAPLKPAELQATSDQLDAAIKQLAASATTDTAAAVGAQVQALSIQKLGLGLALTNQAMLGLVGGLGTVFIILGVGLLFAAIAMFLLLGTKKE
jgi:hypothetical protein